MVRFHEISNSSTQVVEILEKSVTHGEKGRKHPRDSDAMFHDIDEVGCQIASGSKHYDV